MSVFSFKIKNLEAVTAAFLGYSEISSPILARAINAGLAEVSKLAVDGDDGGIFSFKTPRAQRTGFLSLSFGFGLTLPGIKGGRIESSVLDSDLQSAQKIASSGSLVGAIGPTVKYAPFVHRNNPFMQRILMAATPEINKHFDKALDEITHKLAIK